MKSKRYLMPPLALMVLALTVVPAFSDQSFIPPAWWHMLQTADRFPVVMNAAAVLDRETGLVWEKDALFGGSNLDWFQAQAACYEKILGDRGGWRLPTMEEVMSLVGGPGGIEVPPGSPFNVTLDHGWTITTEAGNPTNAWFFHFEAGFVTTNPKTDTGTWTAQGAWCVRGGHGHDGQ